MGAHTLTLDSAVRDWVFIPLILAIALMKLLTQYAQQLFNAPNTPNRELKEVREVQAVARSGRLRTMCRFIPESGFRMRKEYYANKDTGLFYQKAQSRSMQEAMATDPTAMVDMMKRNLTGMVPQMGMGMVVNFFFQGFVVGKVPFSLSPRFKPMLQRGIELSSLDVSYFTSLSFYILLLFGLRGLFELVFREGVVDEGEMMRRQMMNPMAMGANPMGFDAEAAFKQERAALAQVEHEWELEGAEERAVEVLRQTVDAAKARMAAR